MPNFICTTCGTQYAESDQPPAACAVCQDERQYVKATGQQWTTLDKLRLTNRNSIKFEEPGLIGVGIDPHFAIGQRALFLRTPKANVLWDCLPLLDEAVVEAIKALGGISAIAISHPHYYSSMVEWSRAFGGVPIYLHAADRQWVMRPDKAIVFWEGETRALGDGLTLVRCGGHFDGGTVLHWAGGAGGQGCAADRRHHPGGARPEARQLHVQLPQLHPAAGVGHRADRQGRRAVRVRPGVRGVLGHGDRAGRQGGGQAVGGAVSAGDQPPSVRE